jgi:peptide/nickel transport system substrate-binding protein
VTFEQNGAGAPRADLRVLDRRDLLKGVLAGGMSLGSIWALAGCGDSSSSKGGSSVTSAQGAGAEGSPRRGGHLRIVTNTNGNADTFNPAIANSPSDAVRLYAVFDPFVRIAANFKTEPGLALEWNANADNTVYEIKLREGVTWHDGKPFTADDVIYTLRQMGKSSHLGNSAVANMRLNDLKKLDDHLLRVPLSQPDGDLSASFIYFNSAMIVQDGAKDFSKPVGTGPFKITSFTPGQRAEGVANRDYWDDPKPYVDQLTILSLADDSARLNAVLGGQADLAGPIAFASAKATEKNSSVKVLVSAGGPSQVIYMRTDAAPFDDNRVRTAMKLIADRQALIDTALSGYGNVANDIAGDKGMADYAASLPQREQDLEQAKSLLKQAGRSDLRVTLQTSDVTAGVVDAAQLFAQQAAKAGVQVKVKNEQPSAYFNPSLLYGKMPFAQDTWPVPSLVNFYTQTLVGSGVANETHWQDPKYGRLLKEAIAASPGAKREEIWTEMQQMHRDQGGSIIWASRHSTQVQSLKVKGLSPGWVYNPYDQRHWDIWLDA